jgi:hypothetical protein
MMRFGLICGRERANSLYFKPNGGEKRGRKWREEGEREFGPWGGQGGQRCHHLTLGSSVVFPLFAREKNTLKFE